MMFTIPGNYCKTIRQDNTSEISEIRVQLSKFLVKACPDSYKDSPRGTAIKQMAIRFQEVKCALWFNKTKCRKRLQRFHRLSHPFMQFTNSPVRQALCMQRSFFAAEYMFVTIKPS
jgi:hypothetical protein